MLDFINPFAYIAAADYFSEGTGLTWTPKAFSDGKPKGINFTVLGDQPAGVVRVQTCELFGATNSAK